MGNYNIRTWNGIKTFNNSDKARELLMDDFRRIDGHMVVIPHLRAVGLSESDPHEPRDFQPGLLHGPISISQEGFSCYRGNYPRTSGRKCGRTFVDDSFDTAALILDAECARDHSQDAGVAFYENIFAMDKWSRMFGNWLVELKKSKNVSLADRAEPIHYMRLLTDFGFDPKSYGIQHAFDDYLA